MNLKYKTKIIFIGYTGITSGVVDGVSPAAALSEDRPGIAEHRASQPDRERGTLTRPSAAVPLRAVPGRRRAVGAGDNSKFITRSACTFLQDYSRRSILTGTHRQPEVNIGLVGHVDHGKTT
ncbi:MAG: hypothetical protein V5A23_02655, partial [Halobacteriales archaeon]